MILGYSTMVRIERPLHADAFQVRWMSADITFDFRLPINRMQMLFSGLMDAVRRTELQEPNVMDPDYKRGSRLAEHIRFFVKYEPLVAKDFQLYFHNGLRLKPARVSYMGTVLCDRPRDNGKHHPGRVLFHAPRASDGDGPADNAAGVNPNSF